jgi:serine protease Do
LLATPASAREGKRGWIGVLLENPERAGAEAGSQPVEGVRISRLVQGGPAADAGLRAGDVILKIDGHPAESVQGLIAAIGTREPDGWVEFTVDRRGKERTVRVRLGNRPERTRGLETVEGWIGAEAIDLPPALREHFGASREAGVMISALEEGGPGHVAGLELGDVVYEVDGMPVRSSRRFLGMIAGGGIENVLEISLMRSGVEIVVEAKVAEQPPPEE